jgi:hypothetical protein
MFVILLKMGEGVWEKLQKKERGEKFLFVEKADGKGCYILPFAEENSDELHSVVRL